MADQARLDVSTSVPLPLTMKLSDARNAREEVKQALRETLAPYGVDESEIRVYANLVFPEK